MRKSTHAISLVLIGSGLILAGCLGCGPPATSQGAPSSGHPGTYHSGPFYRPYGVGTGAAEPAASPRGGFGAAGHAEGGS
jgi:hypothetical protein